MIIPNRDGTYRIGSAIITVSRDNIEILKAVDAEYQQESPQRRQPPRIKADPQAKWDNAKRTMDNISRLLIGE